MSLDVHLTDDMTSPKRTAIFIRDGGRNREISREEWDRLNPGREPHTVEVGGDQEVFEANITHNLGKMAAAAGIYKPLWRPEEVGIERASDLIEPLKAGLAALKANPEEMRQHNPSNGWGNYEGLCSFVEEYLAACEQWPFAAVRASR